MQYLEAKIFLPHNGIWEHCLKGIGANEQVSLTYLIYHASIRVCSFQGTWTMCSLTENILCTPYGVIENEAPTNRNKNETKTFLRDHEKDTKWEYFDD